MTVLRRVAQTFSARPTREGAGVHLRRVFGFDQVPLFDPFLMMDDFRSDEPEHFRKGFPWHPHRGIETVTYLLRGDVEHADSMGNAGTIGSGCAQWMTAGCGIVHQEMPLGDADGVIEGFQLWVNLPAADKMMLPRYQGVSESEIPLIAGAGGALVRVIAGEIDGVVGPVEGIVTDPEYLDVTLPEGARFEHATTAGHTVFAYVIAGQVCFAEDPRASTESDCSSDGTAVLFGDGERVVAQETRSAPARFLLVSGRPLGEPVAWAGPIVMNTQEELRAAFEELDTGTFTDPPTGAE
jgi:redox-sensitive bicupin YhaK (pirin superfamily)